MSVGLSLRERLRRQYPIAIADPDFVEIAGMPTVLTRANPDGPEAADIIDELVEALERLEALCMMETRQKPLAIIRAALAKAQSDA